MADTWIDQSRPAASHGAEPLLSLVGGAGERRVLLSFVLAEPPAGTLVSATLRLELVSNADLTRRARSLRAFALLGAFDEETATWRRRQSGASGAWALEGGDVGQDSSSAELPEGTATGRVELDVMPLLAARAPGEPASFLVLEAGDVPPAPSEVAFSSRESPRGGAELELEHCAP